MDLAGIPEEWLDDESDDDALVYEFLRQGFTTNVFQMYKHVPTMMIRDFFVDTLAALTAVNAGNRPGPLAKGEDGKSMVDRYIEAVKSGHIVSIDSRIDSILEDTKGQLWYQEQLQKIGQIMAGYSLGNADLRIRKVVAKKLIDKIPEIRNEFVYGKKSVYDDKGKVIGISNEDSDYCIGAVRNGFDETMALKIFSDMEAFASYCFNRSHSVAYAFVGYRTAWLSYYYPVEWSIACLTLDSSDGSGKEKVTATLNDCKKRGIKVLPPDINTSDKGFTVAKLPDGTKAIRYGFLGVKGVGSNVSDMISELIALDGEFTSFEDFYERTLGKKNDRVKELCLKYGYVSTTVDKKTGEEKTRILNPFKKTNIGPLILSGAFDEMEENRHLLYNKYLDLKKEKGDRKDEDAYKVKEKLEYELELLGYYVSRHPLDAECFPYVDLDTVVDKQYVTTTGILKSYSTANTKKGKKYYKFKLELKDGNMLNVNIFDGTYKRYPDAVQGLTSQRAKEGKEIFIVTLL